MSDSKKQIVILGAGFGGIYTAMHLEKLLSKRKQDFEITIINKENYFVYQPMLAEVVGGSVGIIDTVSSIRRLLPKTKLYVQEIENIDIQNKEIILQPQFSHRPTKVHYDHLVIALGNVTDFRGSPGLHEHALRFKNLADALVIRNQIIDVIETAANIEDEERRKQLLTFVVGGGGFSGTEVVAEVNDLAKALIKDYPELDPKMLRVVLIHSKDRLMERELSESLGNYASKLLAKRGVELMFGKKLVTATPEEAILDDGQKIPSKTIISTVPSSPNPIIDACEELPKEHGKIVVDMKMQVKGFDHIWALGDCALIPYYTGKGYCPPTAQFAIREGNVLAQNIVAEIRNKPSRKKAFKFKALGMLGALGHHSAVAQILGLKFSGFFAWFLWRAIYWIKLPGIDRKIKVALSWLLDMLIPIESVQLKIDSSKGIAQLHFEPGEIIFHEGDIGDYLYIVVDGEVEIVKMHEGHEEIISRLSNGEYFGEMALLNERTRSATVRCSKPTNVLALRKSDFGMLIANFQELKKNFERTQESRSRKSA